MGHLPKFNRQNENLSEVVSLREHPLLKSHVFNFCQFLTYLPTLSYSILLLPTLISDVIIGCSLLIKYFLQQDQCDAKVSNNTKLIDRIVECTGPLDECGCSKRKEWLNKFATLYHEKKLLDS